MSNMLAANAPGRKRVVSTWIDRIFIVYESTPQFLPQPRLQQGKKATILRDKTE